MTGLDVLQSVQFVTVNGRRFAILSADDWEALIEWLEDLEDSQIAREALDALKAAGGDPEKAGWIDCEAVLSDISLDSSPDNLT